MAEITCFPPRLAQPAQPQLGERQRLRGLQQDVLALALAFCLQEGGGRVEPRQRRRLIAAVANAAGDTQGHHGVGGGGGGGD